MTASAVTSSAQASTSTATAGSNSSDNFLDSFSKPINDSHNRTSNNTSNNSSWPHPFFPDLTPSISLTPNDSRYASLENYQQPPSSSHPSNQPLFPAWSQSYHSSMFFFRADNIAQLSPVAGAGSAIGGNHAARKSSAANANGTLLGTAQTTSHSSLSSSAASLSSSAIQQRDPLAVAAPVELSSASSSTAATTISMHPPSKTPPSTTPTILSTSKRPVIIIYPTVSPESIVVPIVSCIFGFPLFALLVICCLRRRAKLARERDRRRNYDMQDHAVSLVRFSPIHRLNNRSSRAISLRPERSLSRGFPSLELDTVIEERSDPEQTQTDLLSPESPLDPQKFREFNSS